ncbi:methyl-accepting chemotaxis protein [Pseudoduganella danionis]|nr:methyl-accepting chemotaxis protein [Pseudoduganella danionis]
MKLQQLRISHKLALGFGILLSLTVIMAVVAETKVRQINQDLNLLLENRYPKIVALHDIKDTLNNSTINLISLALQSDPAQRAAAEQQLQQDRQRISTRMEQLDHTMQMPQARAIFQVIQHERNTYLQQRSRFIELIEQGEQNTALQLLMGELHSTQLRYFTALEKLIEFQVGLMQQAGDEAEREAQATIVLLLVLGVLTLLTGVAIAYRIARAITAPLSQAIHIAEQIARGDLTQQIRPAGRDETTQLLLALQGMSEQLHDIVQRVETSSTCIAGSASEIAAGNQDLSSRTEHQAGALEETAASLDAVTDAARQSAEHTRQAHDLADQAARAAQAGGAVVSQLVQQMEVINQASLQIADITSLIDGIAFQTNILALNAAVEAARAGDQGRGFAVVATEVRNLAQRAASAAKDIKQLTSVASARIADGVAMAQRTGSGMDNIVQRVQNVSSVMSEILDSSMQQSTGLNQIQQAVTEMDQMTQQNAALVEQAAAAAAAMQQQGQELVSAVGVFRLVRTAPTRLGSAAQSASAPRLALA